jgi:hypothetical protein
MTQKAEIQALLIAIGKQFPELKKRINKIDQVMTTSRLEEFAKATTEAIAQRNPQYVKSHFDFIEHWLKMATPMQYHFIDVYYAEVLLYGLSDEDKKRGWQLMPSHLRQLHQRLWGVRKSYMQ